MLVLTQRIASAAIVSKEPVSNAKNSDTSNKRQELLREAIKAETGATRIRVTRNDVFVILPDQFDWYWLGARDRIEAQILEPRPGGRLCGNTSEAAAYRAAMGY